MQPQLWDNLLNLQKLVPCLLVYLWFDTSKLFILLLHFHAILSTYNCVTQLKRWTLDKLSNSIFCCLSVSQSVGQSMCQASLTPGHIITFSIHTGIKALYWTFTTKCQAVPTYNDPAPPSTRQYRHLLTQPVPSSTNRYHFIIHHLVTHSWANCIFLCLCLYIFDESRTVYLV